MQLLGFKFHLLLRSMTKTRRSALVNGENNEEDSRPRRTTAQNHPYNQETSEGSENEEVEKRKMSTRRSNRLNHEDYEKDEHDCHTEIHQGKIFIL